MSIARSSSSSLLKIIQQPSSSLLHHVKNKPCFAGMLLRPSPPPQLLCLREIPPVLSIHTNARTTAATATGAIIFQRLEEMIKRQKQEHNHKQIKEQQENVMKVKQWITSIENKLVPGNILNRPILTQKVDTSNVNLGRLIFGGGIGIGDGNREQVQLGVGYQTMNRNARRPKKANKGKRPCSRIARRMKRSRYGNPRRK